MTSIAGIFARGNSIDFVGLSVFKGQISVDFIENNNFQTTTQF